MPPLTRARIVRDARVLDTTAVNTRRGAARIVRSEILLARGEAARIVAEAEAKAKARLDTLESSARDTLEAAKQRGHQEGLAEAAANVVTRISEQQLALQRNDTRIIALARLLAERLLGHALQADENTVRDMALALLSEVRGARRVTLRVNPADAAELQAAVAPAVGVLEVVVEARAELSRGDFQLSTDVGSLEGSLGSRLDLLTKRLREGLGS
jgi:flagellar biosynthesis/type III secretory pathway protein FliH